MKNPFAPTWEIAEGYLFVNHPLVDGVAHVIKAGKGPHFSVCDGKRLTGDPTQEPLGAAAFILSDSNDMLFGSISHHPCAACVEKVGTQPYGTTQAIGER